MQITRGNHPNFDDRHGEDTAPAVQLVQDHLNKGFGMLFASQEDAEKYLQAQCHPAPLGNITKIKPDGSIKHRFIQDLKWNQVNRTSRVPERGVLPRPLDHAVDMAKTAVAAEGTAMKHSFSTMRTLS